MDPDQISERRNPDLKGAEQFLSVIKDAKKVLLSSEILRMFLLAEFLVGLSLESIKMFWSIKFVQELGSEKYIGLIMGLSSIMLVVGSWLAGCIGKNRKQMKLNLMLTAFFSAISIFIASISRVFILTVFSYLTHILINKILRILRRVFVQEHLPTSARSSLTSLASMVQTCGSVLGLSLAGFLVAQYSITVAWIVSSLVLLISGVVYGWTKS